MKVASAAAFALAILLAGAAAAETERIGSYGVERSADRVVVRSGESDRLATGFVVAGLAVAGLGLLRARKKPFWLLVGLGVAAIGGVAKVEGGVVWTATRDGITEERRFREVRRIDRASIEALDVARRRATGVDVKSATRARLFELRVVERGERAATWFAFAEERDARRLGEVLAPVLGAPLR
jgi:hypothetical protein